jgi:hypothetical protein
MGHWYIVFVALEAAFEEDCCEQDGRNTKAEGKRQKAESMSIRIVF